MNSNQTETINLKRQFRKKRNMAAMEAYEVSIIKDDSKNVFNLFACKKSIKIRCFYHLLSDPNFYKKKLDKT